LRRQPERELAVHGATASQFMLMWRPDRIGVAPGALYRVGEIEAEPAGRGRSALRAREWQCDRKRLAAAADDAIPQSRPACRRGCRRAIPRSRSSTFARRVDGAVASATRNWMLGNRHAIVVAGHCARGDPSRGHANSLQRAGAAPTAAEQAGRDFDSIGIEKVGWPHKVRRRRLSGCGIGDDQQAVRRHANTSLSTSVFAPVPLRPTTFQVSSMT